MFKGSIVALVTPFLKNGSVDYDKISELVNWHIEQGTNGIVPCGTTGESPTLSIDERCQIIKTVVTAASKRIPVIAGTGSYSTSETVAMTQYAKDVGADAAMVVTPYYNKPTQNGCIQHFLEVSKVGLPIVLYNHPGRTGTKLTAETIADLFSIPEIVAVKEACGDVNMVMDIKERCDIIILSGDDNLTIPFMSVGAVGVISVVANIIPGYWSQMVLDYSNGKVAGALKTAYKYRDLCKSVVFENNPQGIKYAMKLMEICDDTVRLPLVESSSEARDVIKNSIKSCL